jgi:hypothetical protein
MMESQVQRASGLLLLISFGVYTVVECRVTCSITPTSLLYYCQLARNFYHVKYSPGYSGHKVCVLIL